MTFQIATFMAVAWGLVSFGAVHHWSAVPLLLAQLALAIFWLAGAKRGATNRPLLLAAALVLLAGLFQLAPVPHEWLSRITPGTVAVLHEQELGFGANARSHPISISPQDSARALLILSVNLLFALGVAARLSGHREPAGRHDRASSIELKRLGLWLVWLGSAAALLALAQRATATDKIYWLWEPEGGGSNVFGSFVNRNHFAGWMSLCLCVCAGYWLSLIARKRPHGRTLREFVLWLGSPDATRIVLTACGLLAMVTAVLWSLSRSGILALGAGVSILVLCSLRGRPSTSLRTSPSTSLRTSPSTALRTSPSASLGAGLAAITAFAVWWRGTETLLAWYEKNETFLWRINLWTESIRPMVDFFPAGSGLNSYERLMLSYLHSDYPLNPVFAHNEYLQLAIEGSVLLGVPMLTFVAMAGVQAWRELRAERNQEQYWMRLGAAAGLVSVAVQSVADFTVRVPGVMVLIAVAIGIVTSRAARHERGRA